MSFSLYDADLRHVESSVRCHRKYKIGRIKVDRINNLYLLTRPMLDVAHTRASGRTHGWKNLVSFRKKGFRFLRFFL